MLGNGSPHFPHDMNSNFWGMIGPSKIFYFIFFPKWVRCQVQGEVFLGYRFFIGGCFVMVRNPHTWGFEENKQLRILVCISEKHWYQCVNLQKRGFPNHMGCGVGGVSDLKILRTEYFCRLKSLRILLCQM